MHLQHFNRYTNVPIFHANQFHTYSTTSRQLKCNTEAAFTNTTTFNCGSKGKLTNGHDGI